MKSFDKEKFIDDISILEEVNLKESSRKETKLETKPWITKGILKSVQIKHKLFRKCYKKNDADLILVYKQCTNKPTTIRRIAKQKYYSSMFDVNKKNISKQWEIISEILKRKAITEESVKKFVTDDGKI